jgi:hypothetical protein
VALERDGCHFANERGKPSQRLTFPGLGAHSSALAEMVSDAGGSSP